MIYLIEEYEAEILILKCVHPFLKWSLLRAVFHLLFANIAVKLSI